MHMSLRPLLQAFIRRELESFSEFRELTEGPQTMAVERYSLIVEELIDKHATEKYERLNINMLSNVGVPVITLTLPGTAMSEYDAEVNLPPGSYKYLPFQENASYGVSFSLVKVRDYSKYRQ